MIDSRLLNRLLCASLLTFAVACGDDEEDPVAAPMGGDEELITTVNLRLVNTVDANDVISVSWEDLEGDGNPNISGPIAITETATYTMTIELLNETTDDPDKRNVTLEIQEEDDEHQFFFVTGGAINVEITDVDGNGRPVGLTSEVTSTMMTDMGFLQVVLKHLPPINGVPQKDGTNDITVGGTDVDATFMVEVQ